MKISDCRGRWCDTIAELSRSPLTRCPRLPEIAERWERWWRFDADRPLIQGSIATTTSIRRDKGFDLLDDPAAWVAMRRQQIEASYCIGESVPYVRADIGPVAMAAFVGAPLQLSHEEQTTWQTPILDDWSNTGFLAFDEANPWFHTISELLKAAADDAAGDHVICLPDMTGAVDALANLRNPETLCLDTMDHREDILGAASRLVDTWEEIYCRFCDQILERGAGVLQWLGAWGYEPYTLPTCDFNYMISEGDFRELCMPSLTDQARRAGRCLFHLDGPGASRHAMTLAEDPAITAIQYTPGAGTPSAVAKLAMFKDIQATSTPVLIFVPAEEIPEIVRELDPRGLAIIPSDGVTSKADLDNLMQIVESAAR